MRVCKEYDVRATSNDLGEIVLHVVDHTNVVVQVIRGSTVEEARAKLVEAGYVVVSE